MIKESLNWWETTRCIQVVNLSPGLVQQGCFPLQENPTL